MTKALIPADQVRFFSGSSNPALAANIASELGVPLDDTHITRFSNDNIYLQLGETVRYRRVYIVQSLSQPVNDHLMELVMMLDIVRSAAASEFHAIIPTIPLHALIKKMHRAFRLLPVWWRIF